jgi:hypothetical protein
MIIAHRRYLDPGRVIRVVIKCFSFESITGTPIIVFQVLEC